jgi:hypothetical protein
MEAEWSRQVGTPTLPKVLELRLSVEIHRIPAELPYSSKLEPKNPVRPRRISTELVRSRYEEGSRQVRRPSEPLHSLDKATPSYYTKNESFVSGISKIWCVCPHFHHMGVFIGPWGSSIDLDKSVWHQVVAGWPSHVAGRSGGAASTNFLHRLGLLLLM